MIRFFKTSEWKILWPFYVSTLVMATFIFFGPYWIIYFKEIGFSFKQISILVAIFGFVPLIFEIPTGAIADIYGRKISVILSYILVSLMVLIVPFTKNFYALIIIFTLWAIFGTLSSGADDAWVVDLLKHKGKEDLIQNYFIKMPSIGSLGVILMGVLSAAAVGYFGLKSIWIITGLGAIASTLILLFAKEHFIRRSITLRKAFSKTMQNSKQGLNYTRKHSSLLFLILAVSFIWLSMGVGNLSWQPFLQNLGLEISKLGYVYSLISAVVMGVPFLSKPLLKKIGKEKYYLSIIISCVVFLLLMVYFIGSIVIGVLIMVLLNVLFELHGPVSVPFFQKLIPSRIRATMGSIKAVIVGITGAVGVLIAGILADTIGPQMALFYSAFFMIPAIFFYLKIRN